MTEPKQSITSRAVAAVRKFLGGNMAQGSYQPTGQPYVPNHYIVPVEGSRYGANSASMEAVRSAEEFSVAVKRLSEGISGLNYQVMDTAKRPVRENHPLAMLLAQPNPLQDWTNFIETAVYMLLPTGSCYILKNPVSLAGTPLSLWLLRPDRTKPIRGDQPTAPVTGFEHYAEDGERYVFGPDDVIHIKTANPFSPYLGLGASQLIPVTMAMDAASLAFNWAFFKQGGRLSTVIEMEKKMTPEAWAEYQQKLQEAFMGYQNAHRAIVLDDGAKLNTSAGNAGPKEVDFPETRRDISRVTGALLGVPPIHMGHVGDANRANSVTQDQIFYKQGIKPLAMRFSRALTKVCQQFGAFTFEFIIPNVEDPDVLNNRVTIGVNTGALSPNDARELWGEERITDPNLDKHFMPFNLQPIEDDAEEVPTGSVNSSGGGLPTVTPIGEAKPGAAGALPVPNQLSVKGGGTNFPKGSALQRRVLAFIDSKRARTEKKLTKIYKAWLKDIGTKAAEALESSSLTLTWEGKILSSGKAVGDPADLHGEVMPVVNGEMLAFYKEMADMFNVPEADQTFQPLTGAFVQATQRLATRVTGVSESVQADIEAIIRDGMGKGLSPYEIANGTPDGSFEGLRDAIDGMTQHRAQLIARTETVALQDQVVVQNYKDMGVQVLDVIGCEDFVIMPGQTYGCNSQGIPISQASSVDFHPNHRGAMVPRLEKAMHMAKALRLK